MRHDWIFDVLNDLLAYAQENRLPGLSHQVRETLKTARDEIGPPLTTTPPDRDEGEGGLALWSGRGRGN